MKSRAPTIEKVSDPRICASLSRLITSAPQDDLTLFGAEHVLGSTDEGPFLFSGHCSAEDCNRQQMKVPAGRHINRKMPSTEGGKDIPGSFSLNFFSTGTFARLFGKWPFFPRTKFCYKMCP